MVVAGSAPLTRDDRISSDVSTYESKMLEQLKKELEDSKKNVEQLEKKIAEQKQELKVLWETMEDAPEELRMCLSECNGCGQLRNDTSAFGECEDCGCFVCNDCLDDADTCQQCLAPIV